MDSFQDSTELRNRFLEEVANEYGLFHKHREIFLCRFNHKNAEDKNTDIAKYLGLEYQELQDYLAEICDKFSFKSNQRGRSKKGQSPWEKTFTFLWNTKFNEWLKLQQNPNVQIPILNDVDWLQVCHTKLEYQQEKQKYIRRKASEKGFEVNVHVPLGLVERKHQQRRDGNNDKRDVYQLEKEVIAKIYEHDDFLEQVINQNPTRKNKHIAIVGEAGAGKTTLLSAVASYIKDKTSKLPIFISLGSLEGMTLEEYLLKKWLPDAIKLFNSDFKTTSEIEEQLKTRFYKGDVWLLLDGVDEMGESSPGEALRKISQALTDCLGQARIILTCRLNVWDASFNNNELPGFDTYKNQQFKPEDIDKFIEEWFKCDEDKIQRGDELKAKLRQPGKERIYELVTNPLRLSLLCQIFYQSKHSDLPETKAELFGLYTRYFYDWKPELVPQNFNYTLKQELHQALGRLALAGINEGSRFRLKESFAVQEMGQDLFDLACHVGVGWLNLVDRDARSDEAVYAFFHPNFQEYFAALAIDDWHYFLNHVPNNPDEGTYRIFEPEWKEVILLWLGRVDCQILKIKQIQFILSLVKFSDNCLNFYNYRALLLAAFGTNELINRTKIEIIAIFILFFNIAFYKYDEPFFEAISESARSIIPQLDRNLTISFLLEVIDTCPEMTLEAIEEIEKIGQGNQQAINILLDLMLENHDDEGILSFSETALQKIAIGNQIAIDKLIEILLFNETENIRHSSAEVLKVIAISNKRAIKKLCQELYEIKTNNKVWIHYYVLAIIAPELKEVLQDLAEIILSQDNPAILEEYARDIQRLNNDQQKKVETLTGYIFNDFFQKQGQSCMSREEAELLIKEINDYLFREKNPLDTDLKNYPLHLIVCSYKKKLNEIKHDDERIKIPSSILWHCAQNMTYPEFYRAWHGNKTTIKNLENQFTDTHSLLTKLQPTNKTYPLPLNLKTLENETDIIEISQEICNQIYLTAFTAPEEIPTVNNAPQLKSKIPQIKKHLKTENLALIINNCEPNDTIINFCNKLTDVLHIAFITEQPLNPPLRGFPQQQNLLNTIQNWINEIE